MRIQECVFLPGRYAVGRRRAWVNYVQTTPVRSFRKIQREGALSGPPGFLASRLTFSPLRTHSTIPSKMTWDRWQLSNKAIFYDEDITSTPPAPYPSHVEALRRSMLDFSCAIPNYKDGPDGFHPDLTIFQRENQDPDPALTAGKKALNEATSLHQGGYSEKRWEKFFQTHFFEPLAHSISVSRGDSRR